MTLVPHDKKDLRIKGKKGDLFKLLMDFHNSELDCVKVKDYHHKTANICARSFNTSAKRYHLNEIKAIIRGNDVFLIKIEI